MGLLYRYLGSAMSILTLPLYIFRLHSIYHSCLPQYQDPDQPEELEISSQYEIPGRK